MIIGLRSVGSEASGYIGWVISVVLAIVIIAGVVVFIWMYKKYKK